MIVWNEFLNDARVLKEAESLSSAGFEVIVHALKLSEKTLQEEILTSGVRIQRAQHANVPIHLIKTFRNWFSPAVKSSTVLTSTSTGSIQKISLVRRVILVSRRVITHLKLLFLLLKSKPDILHSHDVNTLVTTWLSAKLLRVPLVYDAHEISTDREGYASFRNLVGWVEKRLMPGTAFSITTTDTRAKFFARAYRVPRPLVLQNRPRYQEVKNTDRIRAELNITDDLPIVLYQGGLQQGRGLHRIIDSAKSVTNAHFVLIGGGRLEGTLKQQSIDAGLEARVHFIPTVPLAELPEYTVSADIGVQAIENTCLNHFSTDSNKLFEYLVAGLPIVASNLPEIRKIVREFDLGHLVVPGDTVQLAEAIQKLVDSEELRKKYALNASNTAKELNWQAQEKDFIDAYTDVVNANYQQSSIGQSVEDTIP